MKYIKLSLIFIAIFMFYGYGFSQGGKTPIPPQTVVKHFYDTHFSHNMAFTEQSVKEKASWCSKDLLKELKHELSKPHSPDEVPNIDGDPFTNSQEYPGLYKIRSCSFDGGNAYVKVTLFGPKITQRSIVVKLITESGEWKIDDFIYDNSHSLRLLFTF